MRLPRAVYGPNVIPEGFLLIVLKYTVDEARLLITHDTIQFNSPGTPPG